MYPAGYFTLEFNFDFFNYAGIHRPVILYTVPTFIHLTDVTVATDVNTELDSAAVYYQIEHTSSPSAIAEECRVEIQGGHTHSEDGDGTPRLSEIKKKYFSLKTEYKPQTSAR